MPWGTFSFSRVFLILQFMHSSSRQIFSKGTFQSAFSEHWTDNELHFCSARCHVATLINYTFNWKYQLDMYLMLGGVWNGIAENGVRLQRWRWKAFVHYLTGLIIALVLTWETEKSPSSLDGRNKRMCK